MGISSEQFDFILHDYDTRRMSHQQELRERKRVVYKSIPEIKQIDDEIADLSVSKAKLLISLSVDSPEVIDINSRILSLRERKSFLFDSSDFPSDYLEISYDCPDCEDTGYINNQKCHCLNQRIVDELYEQSHIKSILQNENFANFTFEYYNDSELDNIHRIYDDSKAFIDSFDTSFKNMLFFGSVGCGKTFMTNCIAKELLDSGHSVIYFTAYQLFEQISKRTFGIDIEEKKESQALLEDIFDCDLLVIDDLGSEGINSYTVAQLFLLLNERLHREKSVIISTNLSIQQLKDIYSERSISRILGSYNLYKFSGNDIRQRKKAMQTGRK